MGTLSRPERASLFRERAAFLLKLAEVEPLSGRAAIYLSMAEGYLELASRVQSRLS